MRNEAGRQVNNLTDPGSKTIETLQKQNPFHLWENINRATSSDKQVLGITHFKNRSIGFMDHFCDRS